MTDSGGMRLRDADELANATSEAVVDAAVKVHRALGVGLREWVYRDALTIELRARGHDVQREVRMDAYYEGVKMEGSFQLDLLVDRCVILELKAVEEFHPSHFAQIRSYLRPTGVEVGLLLNFHAPLMKQGIRRYVVRSI